MRVYESMLTKKESRLVRMSRLAGEAMSDWSRSECVQTLRQSVVLACRVVVG